MYISAIPLFFLRYNVCFFLNTIHTSVHLSYDKNKHVLLGEPLLKKTIFRSRVFHLTIFLSSIFLLFVGSFLYKNVYRKQLTGSQSAEFDQFLDNLFLNELESDPLSLHFMIKDASVYKVQTTAPALTPYTPMQEEQHRKQLLEQKAKLTAFSFEDLTPEQQQTYECLLFLLDNNIALTDYADLSNPLSPQSGIQQQLPFLLSEYRFDSLKDMEDYLALLDSVYAYFESLCPVIQQRFSQNTIPVTAIQTAAQQCYSFLCTPPEENILLASFSERLSGLEYLDEVETAIYEMKNRYRVETEILPAYQLLYETLSSLSSSPVTPDSSERSAYTRSPDSAELPEQTVPDSLGLAAYKGGLEYYTLLAQKASSSTLTVPEMKSLLEQYYQASLTHMKTLAKENPEILQQVLAEVFPDGTSLYSCIGGDSSSDTLRFLQQNSLQLLPILGESGELHVTLKTTSPCLQQMSAPAMYLLSPLDSYLDHTVYLNPAYSAGTGYTTIAHETFPGHLTARVCFLSGEPHPVRALVDFIGWDEGWASLAELYAISFLTNPISACTQEATNPTPITDRLYTQDTGSIQEFLCSYEIASLCLYGLSDIGIHYDGWSRQDTLDFGIAHGMDEETADKLWRLIVSEPAYYLPYSMGLVQMLELRKFAVSAMGESYTESAFCSALLSLGPMPYTVCEKYLLQTLQH